MSFISSCKIDGCKTGFTTKQCLQFHYRKTHGLADDSMPKIEREIPYTLSAYSGGMAKDEDYEEDDETAAVSGRLTLRPHPPPPPPPEDWTTDFKSTSKWSVNRRKAKMPIKRAIAAADVYDFIESEDEEEGESRGVAETPELTSSEAKASLLVAAALSAAEHDLTPEAVGHNKVVIQPCSPSPPRAAVAEPPLASVELPADSSITANEDTSCKNLLEGREV